MIIKEACVDNIPDALLAQKNGADQLEWCYCLSEDGLTPGIELTTELLKNIFIPVKVMIRCRPGNFIYSDEEMEIMKNEVKLFSKLEGIYGFVFGACTNDSKLNIKQIREITEVTKGIPVTVHKAIDTCSDLIGEVKKLNAIPGVSFILSSGGKSSAWEGRIELKEMQKVFSGNIIAAGKINNKNLDTLHDYLSFTYYHGKKISG